MIGSTLKTEFGAGHAWLYVFAAAPLALLLTFALPETLMPFIMAAAAFPVFFYFTRKAEYASAFWHAAGWAAWQFALVAGLSAINAGFMAEQIYGAQVKPQLYEAAPIMDAAGLAASLAAGRLEDLVFFGGLALVSGGAFSLVAGAALVSGLGYSAGQALGAYGLQAALLTVDPWVVSRFAGLILVVLGASSYFYMRLEGGRIAWWPPARLILMGAALLALDIYLYLNVSPAWNAARATAFSL